MQPLCRHAILGKVSGQIFGESLSQSGHEYSFGNGASFFDLFQQVVNLPLSGDNFDLRIQQAGRSNDLFHDLAACLFQFVVVGRCRNVDYLIDLFFPLLELHRSIVQGAGQPEPVFNQGDFSTSITGIHRSDLRDGNV